MARRFLPLTALLLLFGAAACGDDGGEATTDESASASDTGGDLDAFCETLEELDDDEAFEADLGDIADGFDDLLEDAPEEIADDVEELRDAFEEISDLDPDDEESAAQVAEILFEGDLQDASERFGEYAEEECGLDDSPLDEDLDDFTSDFEDLTSDFSDDFSSDFSDDLSGDFSDDQSEDVNEASLLRDFLEANHADLEGFVGGIGSVDEGDGVLQFTLTLNPDADPEAANGICDAVLDFGEQEGFAGTTVEVEDAQDTVLATGELGVGCEAA
jgi:hypothetical protein